VTLSHVILSRALSLCNKSRKEKKRNINNDLAVLPSHDNEVYMSTCVFHNSVSVFVREGDNYLFSE